MENREEIYEIISDEETDNIKELAIQYMQEATLFDDATIALAIFLVEQNEGTWIEMIDDLEETSYCIEFGKQEYYSLTDMEADTKCDEYNSSLIDDLLHDVPDGVKYYFDEQKFLDDHRNDRGNTIASYDGCEHEQDFDGTTYYIYRIN